MGHDVVTTKNDNFNACSFFYFYLKGYSWKVRLRTLLHSPTFKKTHSAPFPLVTVAKILLYYHHSYMNEVDTYNPHFRRSSNNTKEFLQWKYKMIYSLNLFNVITNSFVFSYYSVICFFHLIPPDPKLKCRQLDLGRGRDGVGRDWRRPDNPCPRVND